MRIIKRALRRAKREFEGALLPDRQQCPLKLPILLSEAEQKLL